MVVARGELRRNDKEPIMKNTVVLALLSVLAISTLSGCVVRARTAPVVVRQQRTVVVVR